MANTWRVQDAAVAANVHSVAVASAPWYRERHIANTTLGSLLAVVLLRTAHANLANLQVGGPSISVVVPRDGAQLGKLSTFN